MKLTSVKNRISGSIYNSIHSKCYDKIYDSTLYNIRNKIYNEIRIPNLESIQDMQRGTLENLQNEIN